MEKIFPSDRADLTLGKEARDGDLSHPFSHDGAVMMGASEEPFSTTAATEEERSQRWMPVLGPVGGKEHVQVVACGFRIAKLKLNRLTFLNQVADRDRPRFLVCSDKIAHEKITALEAAPMLVDGNAEVQRPVGVPALRSFQRFEDILQASQRRLAAKFIDHVLFRLGDHVPLTDGAAAL